MSFFKEFGKNMRIFHSEPYKETVRSSERLIEGTYRVLADKSAEEVEVIASRATELSLKIQEIVGEEKPLVAALAVLTTLRVLDQHVQQQVEDSRTRR
jgi:hypothetical protein